MSGGDAEMWQAMMDDALDRGDVLLVPPTVISGYEVPAAYWHVDSERFPYIALYDARAALASACACRGALHEECVWPTVQRGQTP